LDILATVLSGELRARVLDRIAGDFAHLASRAGVDKTLQRLEEAGELRRIDRGLYDRPTKNSPNGRPTIPNNPAVIRAVAPGKDALRCLRHDSTQRTRRHDRSAYANFLRIPALKIGVSTDIEARPPQRVPK